MTLEERQIKNLKHKLIDKIHQSTPDELVRLAIAANVKVPRQLIDKYLSSRMEE